MLERTWNIATGEWLLEKYPNGGKVIAARSLQVGLTIYLFAASVHSWAASRWSWRLSIDAAADEIAATLPWLGGIVAAIYVALYTRFSAQWSYLANLYNQIMITHIGLQSVQKNGVTVGGLDPSPSETRHQCPDQDADATDLWYAAFVEDAVALHLATKPIFAELIWQLIEDPSVQRAFDDSVVSGGAKEREKLRNKLMSRFPALAGQVIILPPPP